MFDLNAQDGSVRTTKYESPIPKSKPVDKPIRAHKLDDGLMVKKHRELMSLFVTEQDRQSENRREMAIEEDFYDNIQWSAEDAQTLEDRGQVPLVYNVISASVDWITGSEKRTRTDAKVLPRRKEDSKPAQRKTELMKYLSDVNRTPFSRSRAFEDAVRVGIGWMEDGFDADSDGEPLYSRYENWRNILHDSAATEPDLSDARYIFRMKWFDFDIISAIFPERIGVLQNAAQLSPGVNGLDELSDEITDQHEIELEHSKSASVASSNLGTYERQRVRVIEAWVRIPSTTEKLRGGVFSGEIYDPFSPAHKEAVESGESEIVARPTMRMHVAIFTTAGMLYFGPSPYRHNQFPLTPIWGYRRGRNNLPYGIIRRLKDIQVDVNKRASKALYILSSNKIIMEEGATDDLDAFTEEASRPDAVLVVKTGKKVELNAERELAQGHLELMSRSIGMIQQASGVTDEVLGRTTNAVSGIAIQRRQEQGSLATAKFFDNLMFAEQVRGEKVLANIEQFMSEKKSFRITNTRGTPQYVDINDGLPENDIIRTKADYVISDQTWNATLRQANFQSLMELAQKLPPNVTIALLDLIVETSDMPNVEELVRRIRQINNQRDPDADPNEVTEEEIAAQKAAEEAAAIQKEDAMADIRKKHADAGFKEAQTKAIADKSVNDKVDAQQKALVAARDAVAAPQTLQIADHILHESGFVSRTDMEEAAEDELRASQVQAAQAEQEQRAQQEIMQPQDPQMPPEPGGASPEQQSQPLSPTPQQPMEPPLQ
ncbi:hypothetical protein IB60_16430 [Brucella abortus LMN1]|uniref:portal protein n=1 Tax=Brucella TaxID=234 RepID=UPI0004E94163|nr:hypothetical protein [Brucella abortus]KFH18576.1 hypothetical protein IB60_16430 [Brucella abortus LMN1]KFH24259.1 hypothetical protein IB61_11345 [Brucella abortus LMN2]RUQ67039.1 hypothetical protein ELZ23_15835 [Brucella abortus]RUQ78120.1 hypothetical protein ELZ22_17505 [Brucella abortus]RUQ88142.1 hypothetical protein ELZ18_15910 [Brucella abortus]